MTTKPFIEALEEEAQEQLKEIRAYRTSRSERTSKDYHQRAKVACVVIGSYVRLRATRANEESLRLLGARLQKDLPPAHD